MDLISSLSQKAVVPKQEFLTGRYKILISPEANTMWRAFLQLQGSTENLARDNLWDMCWVILSGSTPSLNGPTSFVVCVGELQALQQSK